MMHQAINWYFHVPLVRSPSGLAKSFTTDWRRTICVDSTMLEKPRAGKHWWTRRRSRNSQSRTVSPFFTAVGSWASLRSSTFWEMKLLANDRALLNNEAIHLATSRVTRVDELCWRKHQIAPRALSRMWRRNNHSAINCPALLAEFLDVGLGRAIRYKTSNWGRWGRTKLGPRDIREAIRVHATSTSIPTTLTLCLPAHLRSCVAMSSIFMLTS